MSGWGGTSGDLRTRGSREILRGGGDLGEFRTDVLCRNGVDGAGAGGTPEYLMSCAVESCSREQKAPFPPRGEREMEGGREGACSGVRVLFCTV